MTLTEEQRRKKRELANKLMNQMQYHVLVCGGHCCDLRTNPDDTIEAFKEELDNHGLEGNVRISKTSCLHRCGDACTVAVYPEGTWYQKVDREAAKKIVEHHFKENKPLEEHIIYQFDGKEFTAKT